jgi:hypothetical protein
MEECHDWLQQLVKVFVDVTEEVEDVFDELRRIPMLSKYFIPQLITNST